MLSLFDSTISEFGIMTIPMPKWVVFGYLRRLMVDFTTFAPSLGKTIKH